MPGKVLTLDDILDKDDVACGIAQRWQEWAMFREVKRKEWDEVKKFIFATDTTETANALLPWKNKTVIPKLCQIRDNLYANYMKTMFPKRKWVKWVAYDSKSDDPTKRVSIENYMRWTIERSGFKNTVSQLVLDWMDYGNCFGMPEWRDDRIDDPSRSNAGYVGPAAKRISPLDIVFNPIAVSFEDSPKIIRSLMTLGDLKKYLEQISTDETREANQALFNYLIKIRSDAADFTGDIQSRDTQFAIDGFTSWRVYLESQNVEVLTFYGDFYDSEKNVLYSNHIITVADRHKIMANIPNPNVFGKPAIYHVGWRIRQDNLWAMGPLDNLVGMQYRINHLENLKADVFDLITFPVLKIKGLVEDFTWGPMEKIYVGDDGDVAMVAPDFNVLNANTEIIALEQKMEEMAGSPKEAMGIRTPGEKTAYEVQRLESAAGRMYQAKTEMFEEVMTEKLLNGMLELARRNLDPTEVGVFDEDYNVTIFTELTAQDITGNGKIQPVAARHFAEYAEKIQNITNFFNSQMGKDPAINVHISGLQTAKMVEDLLDLEGYDLIKPYVRLIEQQDAQTLAQSGQEQSQMQAMTPSGLTPDDYTKNPGPQVPAPAPSAPARRLPPVSVVNGPQGNQ